MTLTELLAASAERRGIPPCAVCAVRHNGAAWTPANGWHDAPNGRTVDELFPSPWVQRAQENRLPVKEYAR